MDKIQKLFNNLFEKKASLLVWIMAFLGIIFIRCFIEQFLALSKPLSFYEAILEYIHNFYFFSLVIVLFWLFLSLILKINPEKLSGIMIFSLIFVLFPPLIDMAKTGGEIYWSFYLFSAPHDLWLQYSSVFGHLPSAIVYFGTKIIFLTVIFLLSAVVWIKTKKILKTIFTALAVYSILFFLGAFPSLFFYTFSFFSGQNKISEIQAYQIAQFFGGMSRTMGIDFSALHFALALAYRLDFIYFILLIFLLSFLFWRIDSKKFIAVLKNFRFPQIFYHSGLFFIGIAIGFLNYPQNLRLDLFSILSAVVLLISVWLSWKASVVVNDLNDFEIDRISNPERPLQQEIFTRESYAHFGLACFSLSIVGGLTIGFSFASLLVVYQVIAWIYSAEPFRLKRFPIIATFISSLASLMVLFLGYILISENQTIHTLSSRIIFLMLIAGTLSLPIKDFKDIAGDKKDDVWTIPVIFGEKKARTIVASGLFISFVLSVFLLNELKLFWYAMFFGGAAFLTVVSEKIKPRQIFWPVLGIIFVYGLVMVKVLFF
ncbi:MAG TPA: UbiA family prenyltransferase [Candidatus Moranbacteria bacterium]|nr:UbiA family prenyltransferase [Candidatus Moranbacteria bacterium]